MPAKKLTKKTVKKPAKKTTKKPVKVAVGGNGRTKKSKNGYV